MWTKGNIIWLGGKWYASLLINEGWGSDLLRELIKHYWEIVYGGLGSQVKGCGEILISKYELDNDGWCMPS